MSATSSPNAPAEALDKRPPGTRSITRPLVYVLLSLGLLVMSAPFLWMGISAFKTQSELSASPPVWIPAEWTLTNFRQLLDKLDLPRWRTASISGATWRGVRWTTTSGAPTRPRSV
ncbi:hypothetical protein STANM309S_06236 [Streptomyces tanashiensis]